MALKREGKELLGERRQCCSETLAICLGCKGFYSKRRKGKHKKVCEQNLGLNQGTLCASFLKETSTSEHVSFQVEVLQKFRNDPAGTLCKTDSAIIKVGRKL